MDICSLIYKNRTIMTSTIIIPNEAMLSVLPIPPSYLGKEVEVTFTLANGKNKRKSEKKLSEVFRDVSSKLSSRGDDYDYLYTVSEQVLAKDWLNEYEDAAWKNL
jgi:hypothetical protein